MTKVSHPDILKKFIIAQHATRAGGGGNAGYSRLVTQLTFVSRFFDAFTETWYSYGSLNQDP
jgi:hypothetical protein